MKKNEEYLLKAYKNKYAIPQFNINNLEWTKWILEECQEQNSPVIIGVSTGAAKYMGGYKVVVALVRSLIDDLKITIPVIIHLDHAKTIEDCKSAYEAGFDSIMIDASAEEIEENIKKTNEVTAFAYDTLIEAEIGKIGGAEDSAEEKLVYTTASESQYFIGKTNIDMLAPSLGSVHGIYKGEPNINFEIMQEINESIQKPLVLHGGSGLSVSILQKGIQNGICKINFNTELQLAWNDAIRKFVTENTEVYDPRKIIEAGENALKNIVRERIEWLGSKNRG